MRKRQTYVPHSIPICDRLESRTFFSLTPAQAVAADKAKLHSDEVQLSLDRTSDTSALTTDEQKLKSDFTTEFTAAETQYKSDVATGKLMITTDQTNGNNLLKADRATIVADEKAVALDRKNPTAEAADVDKLSTDRMTLSTDTADLKTTITTDRSNLAATEKTDVTNLRAVETHSDTTLTADKDQITADVKGRASTLGDDAKVIAADTEQLAKDEYALYESEIVGLF